MLTWYKKIDSLFGTVVADMITPSPNPPLFCADTVILYSVPGNSPVTVAMVTLAVVWITLLLSVV